MNNYSYVSLRIRNFTPLFFTIFVIMLFCQPIAAQSNDAPVLNATGEQAYCPNEDLNIVTSFTITDTDDTGTEAVYIQISSGYQNGEDVLSLTGTHPSIISSWNAATAKLTLESSTGASFVPYTDLVAAVQDVVYTNTSATPTAGIRTFSITVGQANYLESTGHYYLYIADPGINWVAARNTAELSTYFGLQGYLATILSEEEALLIGEQALGTGWIGGSDSATEGTWEWVTGPEAGTVFWVGGADGFTPNYAFWNTGEPNNQGNEDYAHITAPGVGIQGSWNDLPIAGGPDEYAPQGYIVEYGGMPGDPVLQLSATSTITIQTIISTGANSECGSGAVTLLANSSSGDVYWYTAATGGTPVSTGTNFTTPTINTTTTYYASSYNTGCNAGRTPVTAVIHPLPTVTNVVTPSVICGSGTVPLQATPSNGTINWYDAATGGTLIGTGTTITSPNLTSTTTFYAEAESTEGCLSANLTPVTITVTPTPTVTSTTTPPALCGAGTATLNATPSNGTIHWYDAATGGTLIGTGTTLTSPVLTTTTTFYAEAIDNTCTSPTRSAVTVTVNPLPTITTTSPVNLCDEGTITLTATPSNGTINWYSTATGGTPLATASNTFTTPFISSTTTYYAEAVSNAGCISENRTAITVNVVPLPTVSTTSPIALCAGETANLEATTTGTTVNWYNAQTGGTLIGTGNPFTTPVLTTTVTYYAEALTAEGCPSANRAALTINVSPYPTITANVPESICGEGSVMLSATTSVGDVNWYDAPTGGNFIGTGNSIQSPTITSTTTFYAEAFNNGCLSENRAEATIVVHLLPTITAAPEVPLCQEGIAILEATPSDGIINWYAAETGGTLLFTGTTFETPFLTESTTYYAEAVSTENCISEVRTAITVVITPLPTLTTEMDVITCFDSTATLAATPSAGTIHWYDAINSNTPIATGINFTTPVLTADTVYYAEAVHNNCASENRTAINVTVVPLPEAGEDENIAFCENSTTLLDATITEDVTYLWDTGATTPSIAVDEAGEYTVTLTNSSGCEATQTFTTTIILAPVIDEVQVSNTDQATIIMEDNTQEYEYSLDGGNYQASPLFRGLKDGIYTAFARSLNGCGIATQSFRVLLVQKFFTPNGDGINDAFTIAGMATAYPQARVTVFDRYGKIITQLSRRNRTWDGTYNGKKLPATDYWYVIQLNATSPEIQGHVSLVR